MLPSGGRVIACSTGLTGDLRRAVERACSNIDGATYEGDLTDRTTHLVAVRSAPASEKLRCARGLGLPIVLPGWLIDAARDGSAPLPLTQAYLLPALAGVNLCVSGAAYSAADREEVRHAVEAAGGTYSAQLDGTCTHIVVSDEPGHKYHAALAEDLMVAPSATVVSSAWLREALRSSVPPDEADYGVDTLPTERRSSAQPFADSTGSMLNTADPSFLLPTTKGAVPPPAPTASAAQATPPPAQPRALPPVPPSAPPPAPPPAPERREAPSRVAGLIEEPLELLRRVAQSGQLSLTPTPTPKPLDVAAVLTIDGERYAVDALTGLRRQHALSTCAPLLSCIDSTRLDYSTRLD